MQGKIRTGESRVEFATTKYKRRETVGGASRSSRCMIATRP
jgi:hypothetical protein